MEIKTEDILCDSCACVLDKEGVVIITKIIRPRCNREAIVKTEMLRGSDADKQHIQQKIEEALRKEEADKKVVITVIKNNQAQTSVYDVSM